MDLLQTVACEVLRYMLMVLEVFYQFLQRGKCTYACLLVGHFEEIVSYAHSFLYKYQMETCVYDNFAVRFFIKIRKSIQLIIWLSFISHKGIVCMNGLKVSSDELDLNKLISLLSVTI